MITIDGSFGEGGGQILRSSLALAVVTGQAMRIEKIRAGRKKPGLLRQHLTAVRAAADVCGARVSGAEMGSREISFEPGAVRSGSYRFAVGSAGSATLVLQTVLPALMTADGPTDLVLEGGTHNPWAPPFDFLDKALLPLLERMGPTITAGLERPGFYPAGGGRFTVNITPLERLRPLEILERGELVRRQARAIVSGLPLSIAERELKVAGRKLGWSDNELVAESVDRPVGPGNAIMLEVASTNVTEVFTGFGRLNVAAESVAHEAIKELRRYLAADVPVGRYLADQLLVPMAIAGGRFRTIGPSRHTRTNIELIRQFADAEITCRQMDAKVWEIAVKT